MNTKIEVYCAHTEMVDISRVKPNPRNPNKHPENQLDMLAKVIRSHGWRNPIVVSRLSGLVVKGHGRLAAAQILGCEQVPVDFQDYESEAAEWADMVADNRIAELSEIDEAALLELIPEIEGQIDLGYSFQELETMAQAQQALRAAPAQDEENTNRTPTEKPDTLGDTVGITAQSQFAVIVICKDETEQGETFSTLTEMGYSCKKIIV